MYAKSAKMPPLDFCAFCVHFSRLGFETTPQRHSFAGAVGEMSVAFRKVAFRSAKNNFPIHTLPRQLFIHPPPRKDTSLWFCFSSGLRQLDAALECAYFEGLRVRVLRSGRSVFQCRWGNPRTFSHDDVIGFRIEPFLDLSEEIAMWRSVGFLLVLLR